MAPQDNLTVDPASMRKGIDAIDAAGSNVNQLLGVIQQDIDILMASWRDKTGASFAQVHTQWNSYGKKITNALATTRERLAFALKAYDDTQEENNTAVLNLGQNSASAQVAT